MLDRSHGRLYGLRKPGSGLALAVQLLVPDRPFLESPNADALIFVLMGVLSLAFVCIPFIPGLRDLPRRLGVYRIIWRDHYREVGG